MMERADLGRPFGQPAGHEPSLASRLGPTGDHQAQGLKPGARRYTVETLAAGQPRAYADSIQHVRVTFEWVPYKARKIGEVPTFEPCAGWSEEAAIAKLKMLGCGFTDYRYDSKADPSMDAYFKTRLDWLREVAPGVWEFRTTSAFTD